MLRDVAQEAAAALEPGSDTHASADYRRHLAGVLVTRVLQSAYDAARAAPMSEALYPIAIEVNGVKRTGQVTARTSLVDWLREHLHLTGTHIGCEHGICGACSVMLDGAPVRSCLMYAVQANGHRITTVEGLAQPDGQLEHPAGQLLRSARTAVRLLHARAC